MGNGISVSGAESVETVPSALIFNAKERPSDFRDSAMNHAMVITGVNLDDEGRPTRWKIENSWSDEHGKKGYYMMSVLVRCFVYQAVINKKYLSDAQKEALGKEYIHLDPWDPMGTLA